MLLDLKINNFAIIEDLKISFKKGLNILSGETGAGKSILIDALSVILGGKASVNMIRSGSSKFSLEAVFDIKKQLELKEVLFESGLENEEDLLFIKRDFSLEGRGRSFINATQIPLGKLKEITDFLVEIHGQNEHQSISKVAKHRILLDRFAKNLELLAKLKEVYKKFQAIKKEQERREVNEEEINRKKEYNSFVVEEIEKANLSLQEEENLNQESIFLANKEKIFWEVNQSSQLLKNEEGLITNLKRVEKKVSSIASFDKEVETFLEKIREALYLLEEVSSFFKGYEENINFSAERRDQVEERLALIASLKKKYGSTINDILNFQLKAAQELEEISGNKEELQKLKKEKETVLMKAEDLSLALSEQRLKAGLTLEKRVMEELQDLGMGGSLFKVEIQKKNHPQGEIEKEGKKFLLSSSGLDQVEFFISTNKGEDLKQLRQIVSGGEMSRIMLALKNVLLASDWVESLIFDEVDAGIGGKVAEIVGKKLKRLAKDRQVMVITHLPQIAAMSDHHLYVKKTVVKDRTTTEVKNLSAEEKVKEIARMLAGEKITDLSLKHAQEMISLASKI